MFWLCKSCSNLMSDLRHRRSVQCAFEAGQELSLSHHNRIVEQLKTEILSELKAEINSNFAKLISSNSLTPKSTGRGGSGGPLIPGRGRINFGNNLKPIPEKNPEVPLAETGNEPSPTNGFAAGNDGPRFWLYLSRVSRRVTEAQIAKLAADRLGTTDIIANRLVAKAPALAPGQQFVSPTSPPSKTPTPLITPPPNSTPMSTDPVAPMSHESNGSRLT
ncbi:hypothetical protein pipiens_015445 [Culex pipiens pipiens]|uniref:Uncharacterized protein n=1 Tax=Culex pipiens pipiens TaxID=38569 RepID=A0ABD1CQE5_CULPP